LKEAKSADIKENLQKTQVFMNFLKVLLNSKAVFVSISGRVDVLYALIRLMMSKNPCISILAGMVL
jgi:rRNA-processing protein FCF1